MKHSAPFVGGGRSDRDDRIERALGIVMAPHWSGMSVETYVDRVRGAIGRAERWTPRSRSSVATTPTRRS